MNHFIAALVLTLACVFVVDGLLSALTREDESSVQSSRPE